MKKLSKLFVLTLSIFCLYNCGGETDSKKAFDEKVAANTQKAKEAPVTPVKSTEAASSRIDLDNKGVGPISHVELGDTVDTNLAAEGEKIFKANCTACHKLDKKFIGPALANVLDRRSPEWVMNMILNPEVMVKEDPLARDLLKEFNGSPMSNQNLTEEQARAILEYLRSV